MSVKARSSLAKTDRRVDRFGEPTDYDTVADPGATQPGHLLSRHVTGHLQHVANKQRLPSFDTSKILSNIWTYIYTAETVISQYPNFTPDQLRPSFLLVPCRD